MAQNSAISEDLYREYLESLLKGNLYRCRFLVQGLFEAGTPLVAIYEDLLQRALYAVGEMWAAGGVSVAVEHLATAQTEDVMRMVYLLTVREPRMERKAVISCTVNELHHLGARMAADVLEAQGWEAVYLGADTPRSSLLDLVEQLRPDMLGLSVTLPENLPGLQKTITAARERFPRLRVLVGGLAFRLAGPQSAAATVGATYIASIRELEEQLPGGALWDTP